MMRLHGARQQRSRLTEKLRRYAQATEGRKQRIGQCTPILHASSSNGVGTRKHTGNGLPLFCSASSATDAPVAALFEHGSLPEEHLGVEVAV